MGLIIGNGKAAPAAPAAPSQNEAPKGKRGRPRLTPEQIEERQKAKAQSAVKQKVEKPSKPKLSPKELREKMQEYFDSCHTDYDWQGMLEEFLDLAETMRLHPTWSNHEKKFREIIMKASTGDVFPDEAGMRIFLGMDHETYRSYKTDPEYNAVMNWAQDMRESWASRRMAAEPKAANAFLNILRQEANGGWVSQKAESNEKTLHVKAEGVGGVEAFK